jgi:hypothetical protein
LAMAHFCAASLCSVEGSLLSSMWLFSMVAAHYTPKITSTFIEWMKVLQLFLWLTKLPVSSECQPIFGNDNIYNNRNTTIFLNGRRLLASMNYHAIANGGKYWARIAQPVIWAKSTY